MILRCKMELVSYSEVYYGFLVHFPRSAFFGFSLCIMMEYLLSTRDQGTIGGVAVYPLLFYVRKLVGIALLFYFIFLYILIPISDLLPNY